MKKRSSENPGMPGDYSESGPEVVGHQYFVETFAKRDPSDAEFSMEERLAAFDRAAKSSGLSGIIGPKDFDTIYEHYRWEIGLLRNKIPATRATPKNASKS